MKKDLSKVPPREELSENNLSLAGIPFEFWFSSLDELKPTNAGAKRVFALVKEYTEKIHDNYVFGQGIFFYGSNGVGKTNLASIILQEAYRHRYAVSYMTMNKITPIGVKAAYDEEVRDFYNRRILNRDFLVIDEVGKEQQGEKQANITVLEEVLRLRSSNKLPTIVITNLSIDDFKYRYGSSIMSLLLQRFIDIKLVGEDFRYKQHKALLKKISR